VSIRSLEKYWPSTSVFGMPGRNFIFPAVTTRPTWQAAHEKKTRSIVPGLPKSGRSRSQLSSVSTVRALAIRSAVFGRTRLARSLASIAVVSAADSGANVRGFSYANPNGSVPRRSAGGRATPST
jgi:hypothetical protein